MLDTRPDIGSQAAPAQASAQPAAGDTAPAGNEIDVREFIRFLWRHKWILGGCIALGITLGYFYLKQLTPRFTAEAVLILNTRNMQVTDVEQVLSGLRVDTTVVETEIDVIKSRYIVEQVVEHLNLIQDPEFNPVLRPKQSQTDKLLGFIGLGSPPKPPVTDLSGFTKEQLFYQQLNVVRAVQGRLRVSNNKRSYTIRIGFESTDAKKAALIADTVAETYVFSQLAEKLAAHRQANDWLRERLAELRQKVHDADAALQAYRRENLLVSEKGITITGKQWSEISAQLALAKAKRMEAEARYSRVQKLLASPGGLTKASEMLHSEHLDRLRAEEIEAVRKRSELSIRYGPRHPAMLEVQEELRNIWQKIEIEVQRLADSYESELAVMWARERSLQDTLDDLELKAAQGTEVEVRLAELEREAKANRDLYQEFLNRAKETERQEELQQSDARIISKAAYSVYRSYPQGKRIMVVAMMGGLVFGVAIAVLLDLMDRAFRNTERLERLTGLPVLGVIPSLKKSAGRPEKFVLMDPLSPFSEAIRSVYTALKFSRPEGPPRVLLVISSAPGEGKTCFSVCLGRILAAGGQRVLLMDCDMRKAKIGKRIGETEGPSLADVIIGTTELEDAVHTDRRSGLHFLPAKPGNTSPQELLSSIDMRRLVDRATQLYDLVILDAPALLPVSDGIVLSKLADSTLYLVRWKGTPQEHVKQGLKQLRYAGAKLAGTVMSRVDLRKYAQYTEGDYGYYYDKYGDEGSRRRSSKRRSRRSSRDRDRESNNDQQEAPLDRYPELAEI